MKSWMLYILLFGYALLDAKTVVNGAVEGMRLAIFVVTPSLFPFIFLSILSSYSISGRKIKLLCPLERLCGMPAGSGTLLLLGLCGGYPVGAQGVANAYRQGAITQKDAERLLGFCNNAGPSFIFGMVGGILKDLRLCWFLWIGQILSSVIVGAILPGKSHGVCRLQAGKGVSITEGLENALRICGKIAGWVILFRALLAVADKWFISRLPALWNAGVAGITELSNGCIRLQYVSSALPQFLLCGAMLAFGGFCVHLQTRSVATPLRLKYYFTGKILQTLLIVPILLVLWKITVAF